MFQQADVSKADEVNAAVKAIEAAFGPVTVLFNHAGTIVIKPFLETTEEEWDWLHDVNVKSMYLMTRAVLPGMIAAGGGAIVCTSSISAVAATPMEVLYDTTKGPCTCSPAPSPSNSATATSAATPSAPASCARRTGFAR